MNINWRVRIKNPVFWRSLVLAIIAPIMGHFGANIGNITTWAEFGHLIIEVVANPAVTLAVLMSVWNLMIDPTTKGIGDSGHVMTLDEPH